MSDFAKNLRVLRQKKGMTQRKLGKVLHYGSTAIANYESGRNEPSFDDLIRLADFFDVSVDELLGTERLRQNRDIYARFCCMDQADRKKILEGMRIFS